MGGSTCRSKRHESRGCRGRRRLSLDHEIVARLARSDHDDRRGRRQATPPTKIAAASTSGSARLIATSGAAPQSSDRTAGLGSRRQSRSSSSMMWTWPAKASGTAVPVGAKPDRPESGRPRGRGPNQRPGGSLTASSSSGKTSSTDRARGSASRARGERRWTASRSARRANSLTDDVDHDAEEIGLARARVCVRRGLSRTPRPRGRPRPRAPGSGPPSRTARSAGFVEDGEAELAGLLQLGPRGLAGDDEAGLLGDAAAHLAAGVPR